MYDVNKNAIVKIDKTVFEYLQDTKGEPPHQIIGLIREGFLSEKRPQRIEHFMTDRLENELNNNVCRMLLQVTKQCNFRCAYCVYGELAFDSQRHHENDFMTYNIAQKAIDFLAQHSKDQKNIEIGFYGGEPLLAYPLIKKVIQYSKNVFKEKNIEYLITTNGSLLTPEIANFLFKNQCKITISFDGPPEVHNVTRRLALNGMGSHKIVYQNLKNIIEKIPEATSQLHINTVIDPRNKYQDIINYFENDYLVKNIASQRTLIDDRYFIERTALTDDYVIEYEKQKFFAILYRFHLCSGALVSKLVSQDLREQLMRLGRQLGSYAELPDTMAPSGPCIPGQRRAFITTQGDIFPCERVNENSDIFKIGNIETGFDVEKAKVLLNIGKLTEDDCKNCWVLRHCSLCAGYCDNQGELSGELKRSYCRRVQMNVEHNMKLYVLLHEMEQRYEKNITVRS